MSNSEDTQDHVLRKAGWPNTLIIDVESTGLITNATIKLQWRPQVIEFACVLVDVDTGSTHESFQTLVKPTINLDAKITRITGLTDEALNDAPAFQQVAPTIRRLVEGADLVLGHNLAFDKEMLDFEFLRLGQKLKWPKLVCTIEQTVWLKGIRLSLSDMHKLLFRQPFTNRHRAMGDVAALFKCAVRLRELEVL